MQSFFAYAQDNQDTEDISKKVSVSLDNKTYEIEKDKDYLGIVQKKKSLDDAMEASIGAGTISTVIGVSLWELSKNLYKKEYHIASYSTFTLGAPFLLLSMVGAILFLGNAKDNYDISKNFFLKTTQKKAIFTTSNTGIENDAYSKLVVFFTNRPKQDELFMSSTDDEDNRFSSERSTIFKFGDTPERKQVRISARKLLDDYLQKKPEENSAEFLKNFRQLDKQFDKLFDEKQ